MSGQKKDVNRSRELFYNESRENAYNRQKDLRREIEIDVPELISHDDYPTEQYTEERESIMDKNNRSNASVRIMNDFQMVSGSNSLKKSVSNPKIRKSNQALSRTTTSIQGNRDAERKVEDLYKWQERIKKKHEMQREFQEQIKDSMYDYKVYTNDLSNQMMETKRPNDKVENLLLERGKLKEMKLKALEKKLYGGDKVPSITERARKIDRNQTVYNRLYDLDKSRREMSRDALSRNQSQVTDLKSQRSKSETKVKYLSSALQSPARQHNNLDFFFSPTQKFSNKQKQPQQLGRENFISPRNVTSPMNSVFSPIYKNGGTVKFNNSSIQQSIERSRDELSGMLTGSPTGQRRVVDNSKVVPISIYRRLTPFNRITSAAQDEQQNQGQLKANSETQIPYSMRNQISNTNNTSQTEQDNTQRQKLSPGPAQTERTPVLSNMMFFKNNERPQSLTPQNPRANHHHNNNNNNNHHHHHQQQQHQYHPQQERHEKQPQNIQKDPVNMRNMEAFWEQILQDDQEGRGRKPNSQLGSQRFEDHEYNDDYHTSKYRLDFDERNKLWMDKKNKKIETQRKQKQQQELQNCTFKPQLHSQDKGNKNHQQMLYNNFIHRMEIQSSHVPVESYGNSPSRIFKHGFSPMQTMGDLDLFGFISSDSSPKEFGKNSRYMEDNELQKRLYNYILDAKR